MAGRRYSAGTDGKDGVRAILRFRARLGGAPGWLEDPAGPGHLVQIAVEVCPRDRARWPPRDGIGHHADDAAEPLAIERVTFLAEEHGGMPAGRVSSCEERPEARRALGRGHRSEKRRLADVLADAVSAIPLRERRAEGGFGAWPPGPSRQTRRSPHLTGATIRACCERALTRIKGHRLSATGGESSRQGRTNEAGPRHTRLGPHPSQSLTPNACARIWLLTSPASQIAPSAH